MCKVMIMGGIKKQNVKKVWAFVKTMAPLMSKYNIDGIGYAAVDNEGKLFGQRWWTNSHFMKNGMETSVEPEMLKQYGEFLTDVPTYGNSYNGASNSFGELNYENMSAITLHTRMATSGKGFENTHPFVYPEADTSLIHNGVIHNVKDFDLKVSSCDSEAILSSYVKNGLNKDKEQLLKVVNSLSGYYMCGVFSRTAEGQRVLDLIKHNANLYSTYVIELETVVFSTSDDDIKAACDMLGFSHTPVKKVKEDIFIRMNPFTGEMIDSSTWEYPEKKNQTSGHGTTTGNTNTQWINNFFNPKKNKGSMTEETFKYLQLPSSISSYTEEESMVLVTALLGGKNV